MEDIRPYSEDKVRFKVGDEVRHRFRDRCYQRGVVIEIHHGCNELYTVQFEDGFYGPSEEGLFTHFDLTKIN